MKTVEEFKVKNAAGKSLIMLNIDKGITYLDYGMAHLPRDFQGYLVKYTDQIALSQNDGTFKIQDTNETFSRA